MEKEILSYSFVYGGFLGLCLVLLTTIFYLFDSTSILPYLNIYSIIFFLFIIVFSFFALLNFNTSNKLIVFKTYFSISFLILCVALLISRVYFYVLYNLLDPNLIIDYVALYSSRFPEHTHHMSINYNDIIKSNFTLGVQLQAYVFSLIPCALYSAIISLFIKKK